MAASNTPNPPGEWLAKPNSVAETKITATTTKPRFGSSGTNTYIASAQKPRSTMPIAICSSVNGPPGSTTVQGPRPTSLGFVQTQTTELTRPPMTAQATTRLSQGGSWSIAAAASG